MVLAIRNLEKSFQEAYTKAEEIGCRLETCLQCRIGQVLQNIATEHVSSEVQGHYGVSILRLYNVVGPPPKESVGAPDQMTVSQHSKSEGWHPSPLSPPPIQSVL